MRLNRRLFIGSAAAVSAGLAAPAVVGQAKPKVIVVGGGCGGATAARYIAINRSDIIDVTLIEPQQTYYTCFFSNLYIGGYRDLDSIAHSYEYLPGHGINVVHEWVTGIDRDSHTVTLGNGDTMNYDKLVLSPGIDFIEGSVPGWSLDAQDKMPHAYKSGALSETLLNQIMAMPQGGTFCLVAPPNPYRCPPGPYERTSMVANRLKQINPTAKILLVDPKEKFAKQALFEDGWQRHYSGMIERIGPEMGGGEVSVDPNAMTVTIGGETVNVDACNVIPAMKAGALADMAGVTDGNWAPINAFDLSSKVDPNVHVIGDACANGDMPKSGFAANSQAKVCANSIRAELLGDDKFRARFTNSCWSLLGDDDGVKVGAIYQATEEKIEVVSGFISSVGESDDLRELTYQESIGWYAGITSDMFGKPA